MTRLSLAAACVAALAIVHGACAGVGEDAGRAEVDGMNQLAERYVKLVLALGQHDPDYVDAYYGPPEWRKEAETGKRPLAQIDADAMVLQQLLVSSPPPAVDEMVRLRHTYLTTQVSALRTRVAMLSGRTLTFDEESQALHQACSRASRSDERPSITVAYNVSARSCGTSGASPEPFSRMPLSATRKYRAGTP